MVGIGARAAELLERAEVGRVLAAMRGAIYIVVQGEVLWLAGPVDMLHRRAILLSEPPEPSAFAAGDALALPGFAMRAWRPDAPRRDAKAVAALRRGAGRLPIIGRGLGEPAGLGHWMLGYHLPSPLSYLKTIPLEFARACTTDDAEAAIDMAARLLGAGPGLTPSGDDFVGAAFFAREMLVQMGGLDPGRWRDAALAVRAAAHGATNVISATLLDDLLDGHGWSSLHDLVAALAGEDEAAAVKAARRLTLLGDSSGWDLLAGLHAGARGVAGVR